MKKNIVLLAAIFAAMIAFTSCDDVTDCGCECAQPIVNRVELLDSAGIDYSNKSIPAGTPIVVMGENLGDVVAVKFGDKTADLKPAYRTENTLVFIVPTVSKSCQGTLITSSCPNGYAQSKLSVVVGAPTAYMFYNEFVPDGEYLKVKGNSFVGDQLEVDFVGKDGSAIAVSGDNLVKKGDDGTELWVKVPENVAESHPVTFKNNAEGKSTVSKIYFRDTRNMLIDFDNNVDRAYATGIYKKNKAGDEYSIADSSYDGNKLTDLIPANYSTAKSGVNSYGLFDPTDWTEVAYAPNVNSTLVPNSTVFGCFADSSNQNYGNYVLKFEVYVPESMPLDGVTLSIGFTSDYEQTMGTFRAYCAQLNFSEVSWNKTAGATGWAVNSVSSMNTSSGWMTVTVPLSEFKWSFANKNYIAYAQNLTENSWTDAKAAADAAANLYGDGNASAGASADAHVPYFVTNSDIHDSESYGGLIIGFVSYDQAKTDNNFLLAIDNVRIVPNDGNGAIYPKLNWGKPSQHYISAPRTKAFE